jgi:hypothetical protein
LSDLRVWFRDEIEHALQGVLRAMDAAAARGDPEYRRGFTDALRAVGAVFGLRIMLEGVRND